MLLLCCEKPETDESVETIGMSEIDKTTEDEVGIILRNISEHNL